MIAPVKSELPIRATLQQQFLHMLPQIRQKAGFAFRGSPPESRDDLVAEVVASCFCAWASLVSQGKEHVASPTTLAQYAIRQIRAGRRVGTRLNCNDVMSAYARRSGRVNVEQLDRFDGQEGTWFEILVEDRKAGPAETAAARIDFQAWLRLLSGRDRRIAETLATGETTNLVAQRFGLTAARVSQLRARLKASWEQLQGVADPERHLCADAA